MVYLLHFTICSWEAVNVNDSHSGVLMGNFCLPQSENTHTWRYDHKGSCSFSQQQNTEAHVLTVTCGKKSPFSTQQSFLITVSPCRSPSWCLLNRGQRWSCKTRRLAHRLSSRLVTWRSTLPASGVDSTHSHPAGEDSGGSRCHAAEQKTEPENPPRLALNEP